MLMLLISKAGDGICDTLTACIASTRLVLCLNCSRVSRKLRFFDKVA